MCEARVYLEKEGSREEIMENVVSIKSEGEKLLLIDLFGERKYINATLKEVKLLDHQVILEEKK